MINFDVLGVKELYDKIGKLPDEALGAGVEDANEYIVNSMKLYPPRVQHGEDNPYQWQSEAQRRAYFATDGFGGGIPYQRSQELANAWQTKGSGVDQTVINDAPYAQYVMGEQIQQGHRADGWKSIAEELNNRMTEILRKFEGGVKRAIHKLGLD